MNRIITLCSLLTVCALSLAANGRGGTPTDANITGHVIDTATGEHMPGCAVSILNTDFRVLTDASGHYVFRDLIPGHYTVEASMTGCLSQRKRVSVEAGQNVELNFEIEPDAFMLDQVVVTSSKTETRRRESPSLVSVLSGDIFRGTGACSLADGLDFQPGVRVENDCQNCGFTQVRINGLDGHYSQILMNSRPVFSALAGVYGLEHIPANMIDRVEVMRGGGSALFGSSAVGGHHQHHHQGPRVQLGPGVAHAHLDGPLGVARQQHDDERLGRYRQQQGGHVHIRTDTLARRV